MQREKLWLGFSQGQCQESIFLSCIWCSVDYKVEVPIFYNLKIHRRLFESSWNFLLSGLINYLILWSPFPALLSTFVFQIQAPVSDREYRATLPETQPMLELAENMIKDGKGEELMPRDASPEAPITAYRYKIHTAINTKYIGNHSVDILGVPVLLTWLYRFKHGCLIPRVQCLCQPSFQRELVLLHWNLFPRVHHTDKTGLCLLIPSPFVGPQYHHFHSRPIGLVVMFHPMFCYSPWMIESNFCTANNTIWMTSFLDST